MEILKKKRRKNVWTPPYLWKAKIEDDLDILLNVSQDLQAIYFYFNGTRDF